MSESQTVERPSFTYKLAIGVAWLLFHTIFPVRYHNTERTRLKAPFLLIGNHNSMLDPQIVGLPLKQYHIRFLGKKELTKNPLLKAMFRHLRMISVARHNTDMGAIRACLKTLKDGHVLGIFPEGTRHKKTVMEEMESGVAMIALMSKVPVLPVYITADPRFLRPVDCYYGEPMPLDDLYAKGVSKEVCDELLERITATYRDMIALHQRSISDRS